MVGKNNKIWNHYNRLTEYLVSCKYCGKSLSSKHTTSNLMRHIFKNHKSVYYSLDITERTPRKRSSRSDTLDKRLSCSTEEIVEEIDQAVDSIKKDDYCEHEEERLEPVFEFQMDNELVNAQKEESHYHIEPNTDEAKRLAEKLVAETRYFNEMADLARSKRRLIDLQTKKLIIEIQNMTQM